MPLFPMGRLITVAAAVAVAAVPALMAAGTPAQARTTLPGGRAAGPVTSSAKPAVVYKDLRLPGGQVAIVFSNGLAEVLSRRRQAVEYRMVPADGTARPGTAAALPGKAQLEGELAKAPATPYVAGTLEVVLAAGVSATTPVRAVPAGTLRALRRAAQRPGGLASGPVPAYTTSTGLNRRLAGLGADKMAPVFRSAPAGAVHQLASPGGLDLARAYVVHVTNATVPAAVSALLASPAVTYASPDWTVAPMHANPVPLPAATRAAASALARRVSARPGGRGLPGSGGGLPPLPGNFALQTSEQALLNHPGMDWVPAYEALEARYHQLPGAGETITDVSLGDLDSAGMPSSDPCSAYVSAFGPTTVIKNGQRYLDMPSMPRIPTWTSSSSGSLDPTGEVCSVDPSDTEVGLDFSMMAPLPHSLQRPGEQGSGLTDLLGIAPGASYRLVVPSDTSASITSVDEAFLAAAQQTPRPNVITASLGFGLDAQGFPSRYLEDDPVTEQLVATLVHRDHINVSIAAGDGLRTSTNAAVAPSGGSTATNVVPPGRRPTSLGDVELSTVASQDHDSGAIDSGGVTLDDIFAAPPQNPANATLAAQHAFPEVRWDGSADFSSGFGSRVNVSAPGDNVIGFEHAAGGAADAVDVVNIGGTSASAQEIGAAAAVIQQAARLAGNRAVATSPLALRAYVTRAASPVPQVSQADTTLAVGPQLDLGTAVTRLLAAAGYHLPAGVARVAVAQRQPLTELDTFFSTVTSPAAISRAGADQNALITIAPDWTGLPAGTSYQLYAIRASGPRHLLATGPSARLQPAAILAAAGLAPSSQTAQTVALDYVASTGHHVVIQARIPLTFTPVSGTPMPLAPVVDPVVRGTAITVHYDLTGLSQFTAPVLQVSEPGRVNPLQEGYRALYSVPLTATSGTVQVPVSALQGGGIYGIGILASPGDNTYSDFATTRVQDAPSGTRPAAPLLGAPGSPPGHLLTIPYGGQFTVSWNVSNVPHATGAMLEISAAGPTAFSNWNPFNNPNGTIRDHNGQDSGSVYSAPLTGRKGTITLTGTQAGLYPTLNHVVRVIPTLRPGAAAGEASEVSTVSMNGVAPADGGLTTGGFGINQHSTDGLITSDQATASGQSLSSVETFDQATNQITGTQASSSTEAYSTVSGAGSPTTGGGPGIFHRDIGLYQAENLQTGATTYQTLNPVAGSTAGTPWTPPPNLTAITPAGNQDTSTNAFLSGNPGPGGGYSVFTANIGKDTFGPDYDVESAMSSFGSPDVTGFAQDTATHTAVLAASDFTQLFSAPTIITANLQTGSLSSFAGVGQGPAQGLAVDSATHVAAAATLFSSGIGIYNLQAKSAQEIFPGGSAGLHVAFDPSRHLIALMQPNGPDFSNNNAISRVAILDEATGKVIKSIERFNFFNTFFLFTGDPLQLNPQTRTGYTDGPLSQQIEPFSY